MRTPSALPEFTPTSPAADVARALLGWLKKCRAFPRGTFTDVMLYAHRDGRLGVGLHGPAQRLYDALGFDDKRPLDNRSRWLDLALSELFDLGVQIVRQTGWRVEIEPDLSHQHDELSVAEFLNTLDRVFTKVLIARGALDAETLGDGVTCTLLPAPGYPWRGEGTRYFSAAKGKVLAPAAPPWLVTVQAPEDMTHGPNVPQQGADWCLFAERASAEPAYFGGMNVGKDAAFVTHTLALRHTRETWGVELSAAAEIARCGGLLFPSFAVGPIPASNFGPCTLFADPKLVLAPLAPYRRRGDKPSLVATYASDGYTFTTGRVIGEMAVRLYRELTGQTNSDTFMYGQRHLWALGPPTEADEDAGTAGNQRLLTARALQRALSARFKLWHGPMSAEQFEARLEALEADDFLGDRNAEAYAYLEAKAHVIVPMTRFVAAFAPDAWLDVYARFLRDAGYAGPIYPVPMTPEERAAFEAGRHVGAIDDNAQGRVRYNYAWKLAALAHGRLERVKVLF